MGCGGSKVEEEGGVQAVIDHFMEMLEIEKLDEIFENASKISEAVEDIRTLVIDNKDDLIASSGSCSYIEPKIQQSFYGVCWKLSADNKGKFIDYRENRGKPVIFRRNTVLNTTENVLNKLPASAEQLNIFGIEYCRRCNVETCVAELYFSASTSVMLVRRDMIVVVIFVF